MVKINYIFRTLTTRSQADEEKKGSSANATCTTAWDGLRPQNEHRSALRHVLLLTTSTTEIHASVARGEVQL